MVQFHLGENCISFSDDFNKLNTLRTDIIFHCIQKQAKFFAV